MENQLCDALSNPFVSVIIPVLNNSEGLKVSRCSEKQTYPKSLYKVIVVDNGSDEDIKSIVGIWSSICHS